MEEKSLVKLDELTNTLSLIEINVNNYITEKEINSIKESKKFIQDSFIKVPMYRPLPVKILGVLNNKDFPTPDSKYWQCLVEAEVHAEQLINDIHQLESIKLNCERSEFIISQLYEKLQNEDDESNKKLLEFEIRELNIQKSKLTFNLIRLSKQIKYRIEEVSEWNFISNKLLESGKLSETENYAKQYVNKIADSLLLKLKSSTDENEKKELETQYNFLKKLI